MTQGSERPRLEVSPSLNRTVLADLPGLPDGMAGSRANTWLAAWGLTQRMAERLDARTSAAGSGPATLDRLVAAGDPGGVRLADDLGLALGALVATLVAGSEVSRAGRPDWPAARWDRWGRVRRIAIGGGLVRGPLGVRLVGSASEWLAHAAAAVELHLVERPEGLVLRGAATLMPGPRMVVDAGSTTIKSTVQAGPGHVAMDAVPVATPGGSADEVLDALVAVVEAVAPAANDPDVLPVVLALATYVDDTGQPYAGQLGPYASFGDMGLRAELEARLRRALGRRASVRVVHDGAAALLGARAADPRADAAIVLGTSIGSGLR